MGGAAATLLVGVYLYLTSRRGIHINEVFSAQSIEDHKSFLRMHVQADGSLVVHPLAVPSVCHSWHVSPSDAEGDPWVEPDAPIQVRLIESPLTIRKGAS